MRIGKATERGREEGREGFRLGCDGHKEEKIKGENEFVFEAFENKRMSLQFAHSKLMIKDKHQKDED